MSRLPPSSLLSASPQIPIYIDAGDEKQHQSPPDTPGYTCPTCEVSSRDQPIHCISHTRPSPPSYGSVVPPAPSPGRLAVPELNIITSQREFSPQAPRPALQFDPEGRPALRFRRNAFSPLTPTLPKKDGIDWSRKSHIGLGIPGAQFNPDTSPITPGTAEKVGEERGGDSQAASNFAQRIEQKLWKYSASGNVVKRWLIEIISWTLSAVCMAGIIGMLIFYKDERIPKWPLGLTLNAYISVLSKVASAALLLPVSEALGQLKWSWFQGDNSKKMWDFEIFDNASRGPWGSLLLLVRTKGRSLAALGAAVTLFALALDPFFQQVVEYPERWRRQPGMGSIPISNGYVPYVSGKEYRLGEENLELDQNMMGVAYHYFYDTGVSPITFGKGNRAEIPLACPSSNCTWAQYETFGMCNQCADISDQLEFKCIEKPLDWVQVLDRDEDGLFVVSPNGTSCGWWLKADDPLLMTGYNTDTEGAHAEEVLLMRAHPLYDIMTREPLPGYQSRLNNSRNPLSHVMIVSGGNLDNVRRNATPIAHECVLSWCAQTIDSEYSEGGYTEKVTNTIVNGSVRDGLWSTIRGYNDNKELEFVTYEYSENVTVQGSEGRIYTVHNRTHALTLSLFDDMFPSTFTLVNSTDEVDARLRYKQYLTVNPLTRQMGFNPWIFDNVTDHLDNMATSLTNLMRSSGHTEDVEGPAFEEESFVEVRWAWLALPLSLLALTFLFLIATVVRSSVEQEQVGVWKTSAIATLLYGLPDEMQKKITSSKQVGTPRAKAKEIKLKWLPKSGWRFSGNSGLSPSTIKARQTLCSEASLKSPMYPPPPSPPLTNTTLIASPSLKSLGSTISPSSKSPSLKSPHSTPSFGTLSHAPSIKSMSSSPTLECPSSSSSLKSPPTPPANSPPVSPFEPSFPTPPLGASSPLPPFAFYSHPSPLASNPSLPLDSQPRTQTYYEANPHAYYQEHTQANLQSNLQANTQANIQGSQQASSQSPPPPSIRSHARRPSKPRYPTPPSGWI